VIVYPDTAKKGFDFYPDDDFIIFALQRKPVSVRIDVMVLKSDGNRD
jgi:hypothetical protein